jgi:hypothetical protein
MDKEKDTSPVIFNPKCVYFVVILMLFYAFLPVKNIPIAVGVFVVFYISILVYHNLFNCKVGFPIFWSLLISLLIAALYWLLPRGSIPVYVFIFVFGYIGMAYYDYFFDCDTPLRHGWLSFTHIFKKQTPTDKNVE